MKNSNCIGTKVNSKEEITSKINSNNSYSNKVPGMKLLGFLENKTYNIINNKNNIIRTILCRNNNDNLKNSKNSNLISKKNLRRNLKIGPDLFLKEVRDDRPVTIQILETLYRFGLASIAGVFGAFCVYPIDFVKTRIQNVRKSNTEQTVRYKGYIDCLIKSIKCEGFFALYRGLLPLLTIIASENAIKLSVHAFVRDRIILMDIFEKQIWAEAVGGSCSGMCQVVATNPCEIVKIRLQLAGESGQRLRIVDVIRDLGFRGLYKGIIACLYRDILFSTIFFPACYTLKKVFADADGNTNVFGLFAALSLSGIPAAGLVTPFDLVKTRLQAIPKSCEQTYHGVINTFSIIYKQEGFRALWRGALARICRSSPQYSITIVGFEMLQRFFHIDFHNIAEKKQ